MSLLIKEYSEYRADEIIPLFSSVGWVNYTNSPNVLENAIKNSLLTLGAYDGEKLIGIIRAVGDGFSIVFIQDVLVMPEYQRKGIGTMLVKAIIERYPNVYQIQLTTDNTDKTVPFYKSLGFSILSEIGACSFIKMKA